MINVTKDILKTIYKERPLEAKKYDYGLLLVIGGSEFYSGSPALSALAGLRAGADMAYVIAPRRAADIIASFSPDLAAYPLEGKCLEGKHLSTLISMTESAKIVSHGKTAVVIGGGAGRSEETKKVIKEYLSQISIPAVIDADAIHAIADYQELISKKQFLITPHSFEFFILTGKEIKDVSFDEKVKAVQEQAKILGCTILLKGKTDIISDGKEVALSNTGSPYMSIGGTGDALAGVAGSIMAQGFDPFLAAQAAAFINGKAGELAAKTKKESMLTTDLIESLCKVLH